MARQKNIDIVKRRVTNPKTGKSKLVTEKKIKTKSTNVSPGANTGNRPWQTDKAALASERISSNLAAKRAKYAANSANVGIIANTARDIANKAIGVSQVNKSTQEVNQAVEGGLAPSYSSRDEDYDNPFVW